MGSGLKCVATGSVLKQYQTSFSTKLSKTSLEDVTFDLICRMIIIQQAKTPKYGVHIPKETVSRYFVG